MGEFASDNGDYSRVKIHAPGKINLSLEILARRNDDFHEIKTVIQRIDLSDVIEIEERSQLIVECDDQTISDDINLVRRVADKLLEHTGCGRGAYIRLQKHIPVGFGLGGGSSDAAATIKALNKLWNLNLASGVLADIGASVGSDIPALLCETTVLGEGRGELISRAPGLDGTPIILVFPKLTMANKTKQMYGKIRPDHYTDGTATDRLIHNLRNELIVEADMSNVFETVAFETFDGLQILKDSVEGKTGLSLHLCGSGPAMFAIDKPTSIYTEVSEICSFYEAETKLVHAIISSQMY